MTRKRSYTRCDRCGTRSPDIYGNGGVCSQCCIDIVNECEQEWLEQNKGKSSQAMQDPDDPSWGVIDNTGPAHE